ncbi:hypothetical protein BCR39DRAFT_524249 [Naematelia encephala]|uniref:Uncharacterized protein n=1 Tax=Naematelia encephala TaxID=71784 RepID=A0A1Y2BBC4_9TREE|nr:hypothetical protein BCR39DRAFT_524249 [Naematelia encephala]
MGNCFSDPSSKPKSKPQGGQTLGSGPSSRPSPSQAGNNNNKQSTPQSLSSRTAVVPPQALGGAGVEPTGDARDNALRAAEERAKAAQTKGVNSANPKSGQLSKKLAEERRTPSGNQADERLMDRGQWN